MPGINITGKPASSAAGGTSFASNVIGGTGGTTPPAGTGPAGNGSAGSANGLNAATSYATAGLRGVGAAANNATAALTAFQKALTQFNFQRGGSGRGGGGGGSGGGGGGGGVRVPSVRTPPPTYMQRLMGAGTRSGLMRGTGSLLQRAGGQMGLGGLSGLAGAAISNPEALPFEIAGAAMFAPQINQVISNAVMGITRSYRDTASSTYGIGRAGGFGGQGILDFYNNPNSNPGMSAQFRALGLGPAGAAAIQGQYGIGANSQDKFFSNVLGLSSMSTNATLGDMDQSQLIGAQRTITGMGAGGIQSNISAFSDMLSNANAKGYDKSVMVNSMTNSLNSLAAAGGLAGSSQNAAAFIKSYADTGTMGGRSGAAAATIQQGWQNFANSPSASTSSSYVSYRMSSMFKSASDFKNKAPQLYEMWKSGNNPGLNTLMNQYLSGNSFVQQSLIGSLLQYAPDEMSGIGNNIIGSITGGANTGLATLYNRGLTGSNVGSIVTSQMAQGDKYNQLKAMGVPAGQINEIIKQAQLGGVDPAIIAAQESHESTFGKNPNNKREGAWQITDGTWSKPGYGLKPFTGSRTDWSTSLKADVAYTKARINQAGGDVQAGVFGVAHDSAEGASIMAQAGYQANTPISQGQQDVNAMGSSNQFADFQGAYASFAEAAPIAMMFANALNRMVASMGASMPTTSPANNGTPFTHGKF